MIVQIRKPEHTLDIPLMALRSLHDYLVAAFFILGCNIVDDNHHQMAYPILQLFDLLLDIYCQCELEPSPGQNLTNLAYFNNLQRNFNCLLYQWDWYESSLDTDSNNIKACFPVAVT
jgi:hypothetical protein